MRLIDRIPLTLSRDGGSGYYNDSGEWVESPRYDVDIRCNITPFRKGNKTNILPEGIRSSDTIVVRTRSPIVVVDQLDYTKGDKAVIDDVTYMAYEAFNWNRNGLQSDHYEVLFIREDRLTNGGI